jgi:putative heme-binding domain-containing protein
VVSAKAMASSSQLVSQPVEIGEDRGTPAAGAAVFFDATKLYSCRVCHSFADMGGPVGPDLGKLDRSPLQIYQSISRPKVVSVNFPALTLKLRDGTNAIGIKNGDTADAVEYFDLSALPPVKRTVIKTEIAETTQIRDAGIYDHTALPFTKQELLDVSAYLGKSAVPAK